ncbi:glycosyltransferase family 2 protein [Pulveribacter suum]|uniref:Restriction endonuclease n=1 Tax=Pulveribacter suum TaxID=2116657 RepID=A0A2P1NN78_9BURK|nr:glycosyltransferase [Pulveribacter suum]AVP58502.1 restriction endonuclease [Pulveribacter suum]
MTEHPPPPQHYCADPRRGGNFERCSPLCALLAVLFLLVATGYLVWRATTFNQEHPVFSWLVYAAEVYGVLVAAVHIFVMWRLTQREAPEPEAGRTVDVFVTCFNEPVSMLRRTLLLARDMDYPHETWLLDDGNRSEMRELASSLGVWYLCRTSNEHAKAGNLNHALARTGGELIALFDADHAPGRDFLVRTLGYFRDPAVAFVQTPQEFFNLDSFQHRLRRRSRRLWTEQSLFFKVIQRGKDYWNSAFFCGTCAVVRRSALQDIGGFATGTVTEDLHTSLRLHKAGYRSVYHAQALAFGIAPAQVSPFLAQRVRWGQGAMQVLRQEDVLFTPRLSAAQKLNYLASMTTYFDGWQKGLFWLAPAIVLLTGWLPIDASGWVFLCWFVPYFVLSICVFEELSRGYGSWLYAEQYNFARFAAFIRATLGLVLGPSRFTVTDKSFSQRHQVLLQVLPQALLLAFNVLAIAWALYRTSREGPYLPPYALYFNLAWVGANLLCGWQLTRHFLSTEAHHHRREYRFDMPLPLVLLPEAGAAPAQSAQAGAALAIENVSPDGCRVVGMLPPALVQGRRVRAAVMLPSGLLPVRLVPVSRAQADEGAGPDAGSAVRCRFEWPDALARNQMERMLYGNDLQWQLQELNERGTTPSDWLGGRFLARDHGQRTHWGICEVQVGAAQGGHALLGLLPLQQQAAAPERVLLFEPVQEGASLRLSLRTPTGWRRIGAQAGRVVPLRSTAGTFYACALVRVRQVVPASASAPSQQEPPCPPAILTA